MKLVKKDRLQASFCGADVRLSVEGAFRIIEDMVTELMADQDIDSVTCMRRYGAGWVFVQNHIEMLHPLEWEEEYTAISYISSFSRAKLFVDTVIENRSGLMCMASRLELCAVELGTGKIRKTSDMGVGENTPSEDSCVDISFSREKPEKTELLDEIRVRSTDIDFLRHTNNISYVRFFMNQFTAAELTDMPVRSIEVRYANQTHEGDVLSVYRCKASGDGCEAFVIEKAGVTVVSCILKR